MRSATSPPRGSSGQAYGLAHGLIIYLAALLTAMPIFLLLHRYLPRVVLPVGNGWRLDQILLFVLVLALLIMIFRRFQLVLYTLLVAAASVLTITSLTGSYGFREFYGDYGILLRSLKDNTEPLPLLLKDLAPFADAAVIRSRIDHDDPVLRSFAVRAATTWFNDKQWSDDDYQIVQALSIFKVINSSWTYVNDVKGGEYFARASESATLLAGDCDDHAILMAAAIKAIGGEVRLVRTTGHIYPELRVGDAAAMQRAARLIREDLFPEVASHATLFYHTDEHGDRWINLDYTRHYPGGEVMDETIKGILNV